jgi:branched-chain amino acid transport system substrate-binding protein
VTITRAKNSFKFAIAAIALGAAFGCNPPADNGGTANPSTTNTGDGGSTSARPAVTGEGVALGDTIKVGVVASLTGDQKDWGDDSVEGARLALDDFNAAGGIDGKKIEMITGDSASKAEQAKTATEKLLSDGVVAVVGEVASGNTIQIAKAAFPKAVPVIGIGATRTDLTNEGDHVVRVCYTDAFQGPVMAKFAYDELGLRNVGLVTDNKQPYSQGLSASFKEQFEKLGGKIVDEVFYETGQTDFTSQITQLKAKNPDGLLLSGYFPEVGPMSQQIRAAGLTNDKVKLLGGDGWDSPQLLVSGGDAIIGSFFCNHYNNKEDRPEVKSFLDKWKAKKGGEPKTTMAALGYDAMMLTLDTIKKSNAKNSVELIKALNEVDGFQGVSGGITLKGQGGNPIKRALVVEVRPQSEGFQVFRKAYEPKDIQ